MKKVLTVAVAAAALCAFAGKMFAPGLTGEFSGGALIKGVVLASTNATQTASVKVVYEWPVWGSVSESEVKQISYLREGTKIETLTNWCDYVTLTYEVSGGKTNYYDGVTVATNKILEVVEKPVTNTITRAAIVGTGAVTNTLYSLTASGGVATNGEARLVGVGAKLLIESAPVTLFWE